jgi:peptide/nickel transport system substrate-binding protein
VDHVRAELETDRRFWLKVVACGAAGFTVDTIVRRRRTDEAAAQPASTRGKPNLPASDAGVVRVGIANDAQSGDGALTGGGSWPVTAYVYNSLLQRNSKNGRLSPALAVSWKATDSTGRVWEYELRRGVKFHDGSELTAEDVVFTYQRILDPAVRATRMADVKRQVEKVEAIDRYKVRFTLTKPDVTWPSVSSSEFIVPKPYAQRVGIAGFAAKPIGTGPFVMKSRDINNRIAYESFKDYWGSDATTGLPVVPAVRGAELRVLPESETRISALLAEEVDIIVNVPASAVKRLEADKRVTLQFSETGQPLAILVNSQVAKAPGGDPNPYRDRRVRQALNYAIDIHAIIKTNLTGRERPSTGVNPTAVGFGAELQPYPYDPGRAKALLKQAGYANGIKEENAIIYNPGDRWPQSRDVCQAIAGYLQNVGIKASVQDLEYSTAAALLNQKKLFPMCYWGQQSAIETILQADYFWTNPGVRGVYMGNAEIDELLAQARKTIDEKARGKLYAKMQRIFLDDAGDIFLNIALYVYATRGPWRWEAGTSNAGEVPIWGVTRGG